MTVSDITARFEPELDAETEVLQRRDRLARQMAAVRRRSRLIRGLRFWFPASMVLLGLFNVGWIVVVSVINSLNLYPSTINEVRMISPHFFGQSEKGDHYTVTGQVAVRQGVEAPIFNMKSVSVEYRTSTQGATHVQSEDGVYNRDTQTVTLTGNVVLRPGNSDMVYRTEYALLDLSRSQISGDKHIDGIGSMGHITGESYLLSDDGKQMQLHGRGNVQVFELINNAH
jgi:hypothetical protein